MEDTLSLPASLPEDFVRTDPGGLTEAEAARRRDAGRGNDAPEDPGKSVPRIVAGNLFTLFNLLNFALAACLAAVGSWRNMLFLGVVVSNTLIGTVQELRAHAALRRLRLLNQPTVRVRREGCVRTVPADMLAAGDLVVLEAGNQVPADAVVLSGTGGTDESVLTGESDTVAKAPGDWLLSGSYLAEGSLEAQLVYVGQQSYVRRLTRAAKKIRRPKSVLMTDLNRLVRFVSVILVPLGILLFCKQYFLEGIPLTDAVPSAVAAMVGMIPEGLLLLTSVALTVGVIRLGRLNTLVQELCGIETLARADTLCLDKTGTLTTGQMRLEQVLYEEADEAEVRRAMARFLGAMDSGGMTLEALRAAFPGEPETPLAVVPFSSAAKKSAVSFSDGVTLVLGAPGFVLGDGDFTPLRQCRVRAAAEQGQRVLVLAQCRGTAQGRELPPVTRVLAFLCLSDCIRQNAADTLTYFREQGVSLRILSGDDPVTVAAIARRLELPGADRYADASAMTEEELQSAAETYVIFGRVTPERKRLLVEALKAAGHSVAMTGDGINDIPALKAADCSIAMAGGADAVRHAAQVTLLNPDFACLPRVVGEGRRAVNNVTRAASLFLVKTLYSFALSLLLLVLPGAYPFQPIQLTLIAALTIGTPSFFLALEPNGDPIRGDFLRKVLQCAVPGAAAVTLCAAFSMMLEHVGWSPSACSTLATVSAGAMGLLVLFRVSRPLSPLRLAVLTAMTGGMAIAFLKLGRLFLLTPLTLPQLLTLTALLPIGTAALHLTAALLRLPPEGNACSRGRNA